MAQAPAIALYQPDIALNTGAILRMGACLGVPVHVIHPTGFPFSRAALRRSGMDYLEHVDLVEHSGFGAFRTWMKAHGRRLILLTTHGATSAYAARYTPQDVIMVGRESAGVPDDVAQEAALRLRIPMRQEVRSLNVAMAAAIVLGEALRQTEGFEGLS
ncbi:tRNA (cytidine(34)-2'-O)-methyltransferase [Pelagibacterium montanilacus]|uniref:tRNA (cytidine(34)-2'-O)-methyltransferase n=1 Tax=Pelagibacterium montanilacus TaxID=2185280 RepID=UPI0024821ED7|nr:tRNA (cytidine(34)-2'-O)-methyltransferase [Pelagibacterium montanilacus]